MVMPKRAPVLIAAAGLVVVLVLALVGSVTYEAMPPDKIGLHYTGGPFDGTKYVETIQPGTARKIYGMSENIYRLPATQRNYIVSKSAADGDEQGADSIAAPSKDRVSFTFEAAVYFKLNSDPKVLRRFFEQICLHDECWTDAGWQKMLRQFFRKPLEQAIAQEAKKYDQAELYSDAQVLNDMNTAISKGLADDINRALGGTYFCGPESSPGHCGDFRVIIKNPTPPDSVVEAYNETAAANQAVQVAKRKAEAKVEESKGKAQAAREAAAGDRDAQNTRAAAKALSPEQLAYLQAQALLACAQNTNCTLVVTPDGTNVQVNAGN